MSSFRSAIPDRYVTARSTAGLAIMSVLSPLAGMAVEMAVATRFGTSAPADAFRVALAVVYLGQQFFIGSLFPNIYVPIFAQSRSNGDEGDAWRSAISLAHLALIPTLIISTLLFLWPTAVVGLLAPGLTYLAKQWAVVYVRWFGLSLIPLLYGGAAVGLLYAHRVFWTASAAQLLYNAALAATILLFSRGLLGPTAIVAGVLIGAGVFLICQSARLWPILKGANLSVWHLSNTSRSYFQKGVRLSIPLLISPLINQVGGIVALWSLSTEPLGTIAVIGYAGKLQRMASLLPDVMATVLFPRFATMAQSASPELLRDLSRRSMRMALFFSVPLASVLFTLRIPVVALLYHHGVFTESATMRVGLLFGLFLLGMPAGVLSVYMGKILYALEDMWWPTYGSAASVVLAIVLMRPAAVNFSAEGVAAVYAGMFWVGSLVQAVVLSVRYFALDIRDLSNFLSKIIPSSVVAAWLASQAVKLPIYFAASGNVELILEILIGGSVAALSFWIGSLLARVPEAYEVTRYLRWQLLRVREALYLRFGFWLRA